MANILLVITACNGISQTTLLKAWATFWKKHPELYKYYDIHFLVSMGETSATGTLHDIPWTQYPHYELPSDGADSICYFEAVNLGLQKDYKYVFKIDCDAFFTCSGLLNLAAFLDTQDIDFGTPWGIKPGTRVESLGEPVDLSHLLWGIIPESRACVLLSTEYIRACMDLYRKHWSSPIKYCFFTEQLKLNQILALLPKSTFLQKWPQCKGKALGVSKLGPIHTDFFAMMAAQSQRHLGFINKDGDNFAILGHDLSSVWPAIRHFDSIEDVVGSSNNSQIFNTDYKIALPFFHLGNTAFLNYLISPTLLLPETQKVFIQICKQPENRVMDGSFVYLLFMDLLTDGMFSHAIQHYATLAKVTVNSLEGKREFIRNYFGAILREYK